MTRDRVRILQDRDFLGIAVADPAARYRDPEKHEIYVAAFGGHLFYDPFSQVTERAMAPYAILLESAFLLSSLFRTEI